MFLRSLKRFMFNSSLIVRFKSIQVTKENQYLCVTENCNKQMKFPEIWLRDNCQCNCCYHETSCSRKINWETFDPNIKICDFSLNNNENVITINWSDKHISKYNLDWLKERQFNENNQKRFLNHFYRPEAIFWDKNHLKNNLNEFQYNDVMQSDKALRSWLYELAVYGVAMIRNAPLDENVVGKLADRVGFIRKTTYGEQFVVKAKPGAHNYAYLSSYLPLHTDLPYYEYKPGLNLLHCFEQSKSNGGENLLADGFYVAEKLKKFNNQYYEILVKTLVNWNDIGEEDGKKFHNMWRSPVICLDNNGNYTRINHSIPQRDSHFTVCLEQVQSWYNAYSIFVKLLKEESFSLKTCPGDVLSFNNIRLVHGRTAYDDQMDNVRCIFGAYLDWDIIYSKLRVLNKQY